MKCALCKTLFSSKNKLKKHVYTHINKKCMNYMESFTYEWNTPFIENVSLTDLEPKREVESINNDSDGLTCLRFEDETPFSFSGGFTTLRPLL